jgi:hypothetical protein
MTNNSHNVIYVASRYHEVDHSWLCCFTVYNYVRYLLYVLWILIIMLITSHGNVLKWYKCTSDIW